jgi:hypothetical protein
MLLLWKTIRIEARELSWAALCRQGQGSENFGSKRKCPNRAGLTQIWLASGWRGVRVFPEGKEKLEWTSLLQQPERQQPDLPHQFSKSQPIICIDFGASGTKSAKRNFSSKTLP